MTFKELKIFVFQLALGKCEYFKTPPDISSQPFVLEHTTPKSKQGLTDAENLALSCQGCNNHKYNKTTGIDPITGESVDLFNPRQEIWDNNFSWSADVLEMLGKTSTGRATVNTLKLNRQELKNLRKLLSETGRHPG